MFNFIKMLKADLQIKKQVKKDKEDQRIKKEMCIAAIRSNMCTSNCANCAWKTV